MEGNDRRQVDTVGERAEAPLNGDSSESTGESVVNNNKIDRCAAIERHADRANIARPGRAYSRTFRAVAIATALLAVEPLLPLGASALAQRLVQINAAKKTAMVSVSIGKTEDVRTDASFVDLVVGDPDVADVAPLTDRSLSILGRKSGTTRVIRLCRRQEACRRVRRRGHL